MPLIVAIEPDRRQAAQIGTIAHGTLGAELVLADTTERAVAALGARVPDLILTSALLSPSDEAALAACLRRLDGSGSRVQTLTIPVLASGATRKANAGSGVLSRLRKSSKKKTHAPEGCDPQVFARQIAEYLERADADRAASLADSRPDRPPVDLPGTPSEKAPHAADLAIAEAVFRSDPEPDHALAVTPPNSLAAESLAVSANEAIASSDLVQVSTYSAEHIAPLVPESIAPPQEPAHDRLFVVDALPVTVTNSLSAGIEIEALAPNTAAIDGAAIVPNGESSANVTSNAFPASGDDVAHEGNGEIQVVDLGRHQPSLPILTSTDARRPIDASSADEASAIELAASASAVREAPSVRASVDLPAPEPIATAPADQVIDQHGDAEALAPDRPFEAAANEAPLETHCETSDADVSDVEGTTDSPTDGEVAMAAAAPEDAASAAPLGAGEALVAPVAIDFDTIPPEWEEVEITLDALESAEANGDTGDELSALSAFELASYVNAAARAHFEIVEARGEGSASDVQSEDDFDISAFLDGLSPAEPAAASSTAIAPEVPDETQVQPSFVAEVEPAAVADAAMMAASPAPAEREPVAPETTVLPPAPCVEAWAALAPPHRGSWPQLEGVDPALALTENAHEIASVVESVGEPEPVAELQDGGAPAPPIPVIAAGPEPTPVPLPTPPMLPATQPVSSAAPAPDGQWSALLDALRHEVELLRSERQRPASVITSAAAVPVDLPPAARPVPSDPVQPAPLAAVAAPPRFAADAPVATADEPPAAARPLAPPSPEDSASKALAALEVDDAPPPSPQAVRAAREAVVRNVAKKKRARKAVPAQDEWGLFDPEQCGFAALLAKLEEVTEDDVQANQPG